MEKFLADLIFETFKRMVLMNAPCTDKETQYLHDEATVSVYCIDQVLKEYDDYPIDLNIAPPEMTERGKEGTTKFIAELRKEKQSTLIGEIRMLSNKVGLNVDF
jgi:hypothetical protein